MGRKQAKFYKKLIMFVIAMIPMMLSMFQYMPEEKPKKEVVDTPLEDGDWKKLNEKESKKQTSLVVAKRANAVISAGEAGFLRKTKKLLGKKKDGERYSFTIFELQGGEIFIDGEEMAFLPFDKLLVNNRAVWMLLPVSHKEAVKNGFSSLYSEAFYAYADEGKYQEQMRAFMAYYEKSVLGGNDLEGICFSNWDEDKIVFYNVKYNYHFEPYTTVQDDGRVVFRRTDGALVGTYLELPHNVNDDLGASWKEIVFTIK